MIFYFLRLITYLTFESLENLNSKPFMGSHCKSWDFRSSDTCFVIENPSKLESENFPEFDLIDKTAHAMLLLLQQNQQGKAMSDNCDPQLSTKRVPKTKQEEERSKLGSSLPKMTEQMTRNACHDAKML